MYQVIATEELEDLVQQVNALMNEGWKPTGGVCVTYTPMEAIWKTKFRYSQAMVQE